MTDRPLWRTATHVLMRELLRREDHAAWRKLLVEMPDQLIIDEAMRRGLGTTALYDAQQGWVGPLGKRWPPEGGDGD